MISDMDLYPVGAKGFGETSPELSPTARRTPARQRRSRRSEGTHHHADAVSCDQLRVANRTVNTSMFEGRSSRALLARPRNPALKIERDMEKIMSILVWVVLGLIAGVLASVVMKGGFGILGDIVVGIVGALLGGWLYTQVGGHAVTGINLPSILIAVVGACILIAVLRMLSGSRARR